MTDPADITVQGRAESIASAVMRLGEAEFIENATPLTALMGSEDPPDGDQRGPGRDDMMGYLFGGVPHPAIVLRRLYLLVREVEPVLLRTLPPTELRALLHVDQHLFRVAVVLRGTRLARRRAKDHDRIIARTISRAYQRRRKALASYTRNDGRVVADVTGQIVVPNVQLAAVLDTRSGEQLRAYRARMAAIAAVLRFFFFDGPAPELTVLRVFALAKSYYSEHILDMTVRDLGAIFGVVGATWSERIKQKVNRFLEERGATGVQARFQKSPEACKAYAQAQLGNLNRRGGHVHVA